MFKQYLLITLAIFLCGVIVAQQETPDLTQRPGPEDGHLPERRMEQHERWLSYEESFPAKPRNMWQIGLTGGMYRLSGDIRSEMGYGGGLYARKALGYLTSLKLEYMKGRAYGMNWYPSEGIASNPVLRPLFYDEDTNYGFVFHNYKMRADELTLQFTWTFTNLDFHRRRDFMHLFVMVGAGGLLYDTWMDHHEEVNGDMVLYDYSLVPHISNARDFKDANKAALRAMRDGNYETQAERDASHQTLFDRVFEPMITIGVGAGFRLSRRFETGIQYRAGITKSDLLDGQRWAEPETFQSRNVLTPGRDVTHYTNMYLGYNIGANADEPIWWSNPLDYTYDYLAYLDQRTSLLFMDSDGDGVPDFWDLEPDTEPGAIVDHRGRTLDSDGDGCPDHLDPEPFSSPQFPIVDCVNVFPFVDTATALSLIEEYLTEHGAGAGAFSYLPTIHFDTDRHEIKPEFVHELRVIGEGLERNPNLRFEVTGHADHRYRADYNMALSQRRAESVVRYLVQNYDIDRDRFIIRFEGEENPIIQNARTYMELYMNRRVEFRFVR